MKNERIDTAMIRLANAAGRIDVAAAKLRQPASDDVPRKPAATTREAVAGALADLDALLEQLQR